MRGYGDFSGGGERIRTPEVSGTELVEEYLDRVEKSGRGAPGSETYELGKQVMDRVLRELGIPETIGEAQMVRPGLPTYAANRLVRTKGGRPLRISEYISSGLAAEKRGAEDTLLDIVEKTAQDPEVQVFLPLAFKAIAEYADPEDPNVQAFLDNLRRPS